MAISGLTLAVFLFLLLVYLPGNLVLIMAGRKQQERTASVSVFYGVLVLTGVLGVFWFLFAIGKSDVLSNFLATLAAVTEGKGSMNLAAMGAVFIGCYVLSWAVGLAELFLITGLQKPYKPLCNLFKRNFFSRNLKFVRSMARAVNDDSPANIRMKPSDAVLDIFIRFRRAGKRPHMEILLKDGTKFTGECLRFSWNGKESVLLADLDDPRKLKWVALEDAVAIIFLNLALLESKEESEEQKKKWAEDVEKSKYILNELAPGYGNEVYDRILGQEKNV